MDDLSRILDRLERIDANTSTISREVGEVSTRVSAVEDVMARLQEIITEGVNGEKSLIARVSRLEDGQGRARRTAAKIRGDLERMGDEVERVADGVEALRRDRIAQATPAAGTPAAESELARVEIAREHTALQRWRVIAPIVGVLSAAAGAGVTKILGLLFP